ncbi:MAG TPA: hypothetical protein VM223_28195 [Planctomycetota bacterium]|nr:hypothetical protein [Planctomycetota bacterium]
MTALRPEACSLKPPPAALKQLPQVNVVLSIIPVRITALTCGFMVIRLASVLPVQHF